MTQHQQLLELFRLNGGRLHLKTILETTLAAEYRARMTDLRHEGYRIEFTRGATPGENLYTLLPRSAVPMKTVVFGYEKNGQRAFA
jgi:hypothetical protein